MIHMIQVPIGFSATCHFVKHQHGIPTQSCCQFTCRRDMITISISWIGSWDLRLDGDQWPVVSDAQLTGWKAWKLAHSLTGREPVNRTRDMDTMNEKGVINLSYSTRESEAQSSVACQLSRVESCCRSWTDQ